MISQLDQSFDSKLFESGDDSWLGNYFPSPNLQFPLNDIISFKDLESEYTSGDWDEYFATQLPSSPVLPLVDVLEIEMDSVKSCTPLDTGPVEASDEICETVEAEELADGICEAIDTSVEAVESQVKVLKFIQL